MAELNISSLLNSGTTIFIYNSRDHQFLKVWGTLVEIERGAMFPFDEYAETSFKIRHQMEEPAQLIKLEPNQLPRFEIPEKNEEPKKPSPEGPKQEKDIGEIGEKQVKDCTTQELMVAMRRKASNNSKKKQGA